jgi:hypothetical protein
MATRTFWYISDDKFESFKERPSWIRRLNKKAQLGKAGFVVGVELPPAPEMTRVELVRKNERRLAQEATSLADAAGGDAPRLFMFAGAAVRHVEKGVLWIAGFGDGICFLLVGSASNAIGTPLAQSSEQEVFSPTVDPLGTIQRFFSHEQSTAPDGPADYLWSAVAATQMQFGGFGAAPRVAGIAQYAGRTDVANWLAKQADVEGASSLVIGSPLFVEQV